MPECQQCGSMVTPDYVRVMSTDGENVTGCPSCDAVPAGRDHIIGSQAAANNDQSDSPTTPTRLEGWR